MKLTDEELLTAYEGKASIIGGCRAVQDAVLAKAEPEIREREIAAAIWGAGVGECGVEGTYRAVPKAPGFLAAVARRYPSLRPPVSVTLSTGTWTLQDGGIWQLTGGHARYDHCIYAPCKTVEDHQKVLAYLLSREGR